MTLIPEITVDLLAGLNDNPLILRKLSGAARELAELKGVAASIPNQTILINMLGLQEAKDSSEVENIVTTHDELFRETAEAASTPAAKEVARYREALWVGFQRVREHKLLTNNIVLEIQKALECNNAGFRRIPGTELRDNAGNTVYVPPEPHHLIPLMTRLERFVNEPAVVDVDPLIKMALIHHQFESIHPFYDGNGRSGRIINVLYLVKEGLLDIPVLYMSRYIARTKPEYYRLLQAVRERGAWEEWVLYLLDAVEKTARESIADIHDIKTLLLSMKHQLRERYRFYSQDLINNLFTHPYTKVEYVMRDLKVSRLTASSYLNQLARDKVLNKVQIGRTNCFINHRLCQLFSTQSQRVDHQA